MAGALPPLPTALADEPWRLSAAEAARRLREGSLSAEALLRGCLARIADREPFLRAWNHVDEAGALRAAREADKAMLGGAPRGVLHGLPLGVKDMIDAAGLPTTHNSPIYQGHIAAQDAACVAIARGEGAVVLGKTDTLEFAAAGRRPLTRNPHNGAHSPGGSSSGSAAAVADGMVPLAFGTQTGGSTIRPASFCGAYAMKPSHGLVCRDGAKTYSHSLDTIGWYGRGVADLALVAEALRLPAPPVPAAPPGRPLRIALCRTPHWAKADPATQAALETAAARLRAAGAVVEEAELPAPFSGLDEAQQIIMHSEGRGAFLPEYLHHHALLHQDFRDRVENARNLSTAALREAHDLAAGCRRIFDTLAGAYDAVLAPAAPGEAPADLRDPGNPVFNAMWTLLHVPCIALPCTRGPQGLPVGVQLIGPRYSDLALLEVAARAALAVDAEKP
ncbi:amidase [Roseomonas sp. GC11]|uniref:amidase n=1 Tax=Roseomonas sp. GC11 TaxID=2950546 RepID=UPI00210B88F7|nr:amidase [Roseomonas sp. GC11]MCQ4159086.1 amidase [Roseomonas sp. GC11]